MHNKVIIDDFATPDDTSV